MEASGASTADPTGLERILLFQEEFLDQLATATGAVELWMGRPCCS